MDYIGAGHMRTFWGRVLHAVLFEIVLLGISTPVVALVFDKPLSQTSALNVGLSLTAMICNGLYNYGFDRMLVFLNRPLYPRSFGLRCFHSVLFEICLMVFTLPMIIWWMDFSFFQALSLDVSFSVSVPIYALVFNWIYDLILPAPAVHEITA